MNQETCVLNAFPKNIKNLLYDYIKFCDIGHPSPFVERE
jgi:hypothetical protein